MVMAVKQLPIIQRRYPCWKCQLDQSVQIVKEDDTYKISWSYAQIFPQMQNGDGIQISSEEAKRGSILDRNGKVIAGDDQAIVVAQCQVK